MMETVLNLGLNDETVEGLAARTGNERFAWDCYRRFITMFGDVVLGIKREAFEEQLDGGEGAARRPDRSRGAGRGAAQARRRPTRTSSPSERARRFPQDPKRAAPAGHQRRLRVVVRQEGDRVPAHQRHPGRLGHGGHRDVDGVRQPRRDLGHRRGLHARSPHGRAALLRRVPRQRAGRGRGGGHPHARARSTISSGACRRSTTSCSRIAEPPRAPLQGHAGHRVHHPGGQALPPADALGQAVGARRRAGGRGPRARARDRSAHGAAARAAAGAQPGCSIRVFDDARQGARRSPTGRLLGARPAGGARRGGGQVVFDADRAVEWAKDRTRRSSSCAPRPRRRTWRACTRRRAS